MNAIVLLLVKGISKLPFPLLYALSDLLNFILFKILGYRKTVIRENLINSFPEKSAAEIDNIMTTFCGYLCDLILEGIKTYSISAKDLEDRVRFNNLDVIKNWYKKDQDIIMIMGHYGNWEYGASRFGMVKDAHELLVVYKPLTNKPFDEFMRKARTRFGNITVPMRETYKMIEELKLKNERFAVGLIGDQAPSPQKGYWMEFLNQDTPVFLGCEKIAKEHNFPLVYILINRTKRGFYEITFHDICTDPKNTRNGEITELQTKLLEQAIKLEPEIWVWSHKRWKHRKRPTNLPQDQISKEYVAKNIQWDK